MRVQGITRSYYAPFLIKPFDIIKTKSEGRFSLEMGYGDLMGTGSAFLAEG